MSKKIMSPVDELFVKLPYAVLMDESLTSADKLVYASLRIWARVERGRFILFPAVSTISKVCGISARQVHISLDRLSDGPRPLIRRERRTRGKRDLTCVITLLRLSSTYGIRDLNGYWGGENSAPPPAEIADEVDGSEADVYPNDPNGYVARRGIASLHAARDDPQRGKRGITDYATTHVGNGGE